MLAEDFCGFGPQYGRIGDLLQSHHTDSLVIWDQTLADYSTAYAFARYAADQYDYDGSLLNLVMNNGQTGPSCWNSALSSAAGTTFDLTFGNWVIATVLDADGYISPYGYTSVRMHDTAHGLNGIQPAGTNVNGSLASLAARSFRAYYYSAASGTVKWNGAGPSIRASLLAGRQDGTVEVVANLLAGQSKTFADRAWLVLANHSNSSSEVGGSVQFQGVGQGVSLPIPVNLPASRSVPQRLCGTPMLPF